MKSICLRQPWATLVASGQKTVETRIWATKYRGPVLIVASRSHQGETPAERTLPHGLAVAVAVITGCRPMTEADEEAACCTLYPRAVAWQLTNVMPIEKPFPVKGQLGIFDVDTVGGGAPTRVPISEASTASTAIAGLRVAGYCRVSTEEQAQEGVSMDAQKKYLREWADRMGWTRTVLYADPGCSGKDRERPKLKKMMEDAKVGFDPTTRSRDPSKSRWDMVLAYNNDRLSRDVRDTLSIIDELAQVGVTVKFGVVSNVDLATPEGRFLLTNLAAGAEFYRRDIAQKTKMGMASLADKGHHLGRPPWGFRINDAGILEMADKRVQIIWDLHFRPQHTGVTRIARSLGLSPRTVASVLSSRSKVLAEWRAAGISPTASGASSQATPSGTAPPAGRI